MLNGGKRKGAGRPKGSTNKVRFSDFVSAEDKATFIEFMLSNYMGDMRLAVWVGDQLFGKAPQAIDMTSNGETLASANFTTLTNEQLEQLAAGGTSGVSKAGTGTTQA